jgi:5-dehydro-2-deoxygluconokinase
VIEPTTRIAAASCCSASRRPEDELIAGFRTAALNPVVKGFAVGRTIFADAAARWLSGEIDDAAAIDDLATRPGALVHAWRTARGAA